MTDKPPYRTGRRCQGWGRLFGHKWVKTVGSEYVYTSENCYRCGMPRNGWLVANPPSSYVEPEPDDSPW